MKKVALPVLIFGLFLSPFAFAQDPFTKLVEKDLNSYLSETINEGEISAEVLKVQGEPQIKCSNVIFNKGRKIVFCTADFKTTYGENSQSHGSTTCTSLGYILNKKGEIESNYNPEMFQKCLEKISDASYD